MRFRFLSANLQILTNEDLVCTKVEQQKKQTTGSETRKKSDYVNNYDYDAVSNFDFNSGADDDADVDVR